MNNLGEQYFPVAFIPEYIHNHPNFGIKRILTYTVFRFFSFAGKEDSALAQHLKNSLFPCEDTFDFSLIERYLSEDMFFAPALETRSFDPFFLYTAICIVEDFFDDTVVSDELSVVDNLIFSLYPVLGSASLDDDGLEFETLLQSGAEFYAALYLTLTRYSSSLGKLLPKLGTAYREDFHFTCEDFILYDFMEEYFETEHCLTNPDFLELIDTLVQATLNYYDTDFDRLLTTEIPPMLQGTSSRFAPMKRYGCMTVSYLPDRDASLSMLEEIFRYTAAYELRNHLFDYHLDEDKLITLANWKEKLKWHYVQYSHVLEPALDFFYGTVLSQKLLKYSFEENITELSENT